jgi:hypothetical protein
MWIWSAPSEIQEQSAAAARSPWLGKYQLKTPICTQSKNKHMRRLLNNKHRLKISWPCSGHVIQIRKIKGTGMDVTSDGSQRILTRGCSGNGPWGICTMVWVRRVLRRDGARGRASGRWWPDKSRVGEWRRDPPMGGSATTKGWKVSGALRGNRLQDSRD